MASELYCGPKVYLKPMNRVYWNSVIISISKDRLGLISCYCAHDTRWNVRSNRKHYVTKSPEKVQQLISMLPRNIDQKCRFVQIELSVDNASAVNEWLLNTKDSRSHDDFHPHSFGDVAKNQYYTLKGGSVTQALVRDIICRA